MSKIINNITNIVAVMRLSKEIDQPECTLIPIIAWKISGNGVQAILPGRNNPVPVRSLILHDPMAKVYWMEGKAYQGDLEDIERLINIDYLQQELARFLGVDLSIKPPPLERPLTETLH